ncbi:MAG: ATP-binding protein [Nitrospiraceae bacterium]|nr:ATP-binding protein [Nitrospiraceae bacterium]
MRLPKDSAVVTIPSHPKYLCVVREAAARMADMGGFDASSVEDIRLAVDEACSNVIKYAYGGDSGKQITVRFRNSAAGFEALIEDSGPRTDPACLKGRDLDEVRPGGLGMHFIRRTFDVVAFDEKKRNGNRLRLLKYRDRGHEDRHTGT